MAELVELLRGWQACHAARRVEARFWCCDALALCAGPLAARRGSFDVVDTSNLAEHVGLLSLLALAAPLLRAAPHARWGGAQRRCTRLWGGGFV